MNKKETQDDIIKQLTYDNNRIRADATHSGEEIRDLRQKLSTAKGDAAVFVWLIIISWLAMAFVVGFHFSGKWI